MEAFRRIMRGWGMRILLSVLALSFVLWGIPGDFLGLGSTDVIKVGSTGVSQTEYNSMFGEELRVLTNETGRQLSVEDARRAGVDQRIFAKLKVDEHARQLGIAYNDQAVLDRLAKSPGFSRPDGTIDANALRLRLQQTGISEQQFFNTERRNGVRAQLVESIINGAPVPNVLLDAMNTFQFEQRVIDMIIVPDDKAAKPPAPDEAKLKTFYEERKADFMAPEYRKLTLLIADPNALKASIKVTPDEIKASYEATKANYATPETRNIQQIVFPDLAAAQKAYAELQAGKDFVEVAKAAGKSESDINRGVVRKEDLIDKKAAEAAFSFGAQTYTAPIEGDLSVSILRARDIKPATQKTFEEVKDQVEDLLKLEGARRRVLDLAAQIDEKRANAVPLRDIAKEFALELREVDAVDRQGKGKDGKSLGIPAAATLLPIAFTVEAGVETEVLSRGDDGYLWYEIVDITPARQKDYDEVKTDVVTAWTAAETQKALSELGRTLVKRLQDGVDLKTIASELQLPVKTSAPFTRINPGDVPASAAKLAFTLAKGAAGTVSADDGKGRVVMRLMEIKPPAPLEPARRDSLAERLGTLAENDWQAQYLAALDRQLGFTVDARSFGQLTSRPGFGS